MKSSTSVSSSDVLVRVRELSIAFDLQRYSSSLRDSFVEAATNPLGLIRKREQRFEALASVSLELRRGDRLAILGANGSGKTTLCRAITGMYGSRREVTVNGDVRAIFDTEAAVFPELSGRENMEVISHLLFPRLRARERAELVAEAIDFSELAEFIDSPFKVYSKGMKARLFLSLVSAKPADILILDEVFNGADFFFNEKITKRILRAIAESHAAIFISHSHEVVQQVCNRAIVLQRGKVVFSGSCPEAVDYYLASGMAVAPEASST